MTKCENVASYMLANTTTVRSTAKHFGIGKSTVHKLVTTDLEKTNTDMYCDMRKLLDENWNTKHIRGGDATRQKYSK